VYILSWVVIPIAQEYEGAGDFSSNMRLKRAIKNNLKFYLIFGVVGIVFVIYLMIKNKLSW
jgi:hypothetical protein